MKNHLLVIKTILCLLILLPLGIIHAILALAGNAIGALEQLGHDKSLLERWKELTGSEE